MSSDPVVEIIYVRESAVGSIVSDIFTWLMVISIIGVGWLMESSAMEWCGFLMFGLAIIARSAGVSKKISPQEAANRLFRDCGVRADVE